MRYRRPSHAVGDELNMTPMIDLVFLLIAFFTVVINFTEADQNERIKLPSSELAKPPEVPPESPITLQITENGTVLLGGNEFELSQLKGQLEHEKQFTMLLPGADFRNTDIILRADGWCPTGKVQEVIAICQDVGYDRFSLRAKAEEDRLASPP